MTHEALGIQYRVCRRELGNHMDGQGWKAEVITWLIQQNTWTIVYRVNCSLWEKNTYSGKQKGEKDEWRIKYKEK